jgi:hypothetical protein
MGECGCGSTVPHKILKVGKSVMYVELYRGCDYCDTGIMVTVGMVTPDVAEMNGWKPDEIFEAGKDGWSQFDFPIISPEDLIDAVKKMKCNDAVGEGGYDSLTDWLQDSGLELLQTAVRLRVAKTNKQTKRVSFE